VKVRPASLIVKDQTVLCLIHTYEGQELCMLPGGNVEFGESVDACLQRELEEELGLIISIKEGFCIGETHNALGDKLHIVKVAEIISGKPKINPEHTSAHSFRWISMDSIPAHIWYPHIPDLILAWLKEGLKPTSEFIGEIQQPLLGMK
jgi:8-oxo-dGTP diphosphatase